MKPARKKIQKTRNYALRAAENLIKETGDASGKNVEILWKVEGSKERHVIVNKAVAFKQCQDDAIGAFLPPFTQLSIP